METTSGSCSRDPKSRCCADSVSSQGPPFDGAVDVFLEQYLAAVVADRSDLVKASDQILSRERLALSRRIATLSKRVEMHREILEQLEVELAAKQRMLREIEELSDRRPQLRLERLDRQLRGRRIQEVAVQVLRQKVGRGEPVHYREWFGLVTAEGFEIAGRDPLNTFLASIGRADAVQRVGERSGLYALK